MNFEQLLIWALNGVMAVAATVLWSIIQEMKTKHKELEIKIDKLEDAHAAHQVDVNARFVTREELKSFINSLTQTLDRQTDKLENRLARMEELILHRGR